MNTISVTIKANKSMSVIIPVPLVEGENLTSQIAVDSSLWDGCDVHYLLTTPRKKMVDPIPAASPVDLTNAMLDGPGVLLVECIGMKNGVEVIRTREPASIPVYSARKALGDISPEHLPDFVAEMVNAKNGANNAAELASAKAISCEETESAIKINETSRARAEEERVSAEANRNVSYATAESMRNTTFNNAESLRAGAESNRVIAEQNRVNAEEFRKTNETARTNAEIARGMAEENRATAEAARTTAETDRSAAESNRDTAEQDREAAEVERETVKEECIAATASAISVVSYATKQYGLYWDGTTTPNGTRLGDAVGKVFNPAVGVTIGQNDFENLRPWRDCVLCNINDAGQVVAYNGQPGFKIDGSNGQVMLEIPKFYYKSIASGDARERWIAPDPCTGYTVHPAFVVNGIEKSKIYVGAYMGSEDAGKLSSKTGVLSQYNKTISQLRTLARARGAGWGLCDLASYTALQLLLLVMMGGHNAQSKVGKGISEMRYNAADTATVAEATTNRIIVANAVATNFAVGDMIGIGTSLGGNQIAMYRQITAIAAYDAPNTAIAYDGTAINVAIGNIVYAMPRKTGGADALGQHTGRAAGTDGKTEVSVLGLQGMWGNIWQMIDGANMDSGYYMWYNSDPTTCASDVFAAPYKRIGAPLPQADGYIRRMGFDTAEPWSMLPSDVGGDSAGPVGDYYTRSATPGSRIALVGGNFYSGAPAGPWYWIVNISSGIASWNIGARLLYKPV